MSYGTLSSCEDRATDRADLAYERQCACDDALAVTVEKIWQELGSRYNEKMVEEAIASADSKKLFELFLRSLDVRDLVEEYWDKQLEVLAEKQMAKDTEESLNKFYFASHP